MDEGVSVKNKRKSIKNSFGVVPVGAVIPLFEPEDFEIALPPTFVRCDGQEINDSDSPFDGQEVPDLNGEQRYLRGAESSGDTGGYRDWSIEWERQGISTSTGDAVDSIKASEDELYEHEDHGGATGYIDVPEPPYIDVVYIMRIK